MFRSLSLLTLAALSLTACNKFRVSVTDSGLKYQFHEQHEDARKAKKGDILTFHLVLKNSTDSVLRDTHKELIPLKVALQEPAFKGAFEEGLAMMAKGDSATFFVSADSLFTKAGQPLPPAIAKGSDVGFTVKLLDVQTMQEYEKAAQEQQKKQKETDAKLIADYIAKNKLANPQQSPLGVTYAISTPGTGALPSRGDSVQVLYTGKLLNGKEFDKNTTTGITFPVGVGMVIPGWDDALLRLHKGDKATLLIPSELAYGANGVPGSIPGNSVLTFDVQVLNIKKGSGPRPQ